MLVLTSLPVSNIRSSNVSASTVPSYTKEEQDLSAVIRYMQPAHTIGSSIALAKAIIKHSKRTKVDKVLMLSIMYQESSLKLDPQGCFKDKKKCAPDYGIGQINFKTWGKFLNLDKNKLLTNVDYSVWATSEVLRIYKKQYSKEKDWHSRYHSKTYHLRYGYYKLIEKGYNKIITYTRGYKDGQTKYRGIAQNLHQGQ